MIQYILDPTQFHHDLPSINGSLSTTDLKFLLSDIVEKAPTNFISSGTYEGIYKDQNVSLLLTNDLLVRPREKQEDAVRIEVLAPREFNNGGFGRVYKSYGVLIPEEGYRFKRKAIEKSRLCKRIACDDEDKEKDIVNEAQYTQLNPLLHCKSPIFDDHAGYLVMRRAQKEDLHSLMNSIYKKKVMLTVEERLDLTFWLINAYKEQVYDLGLIHNDIKPENIIVDWKEFNVTIIDYAFANHFSHHVTDSCIYGTPDYIAPELFAHQTRTVSSDLYALGLTIALFWGYVPEVNIDDSLTIEEIKQLHLTRHWYKLFEGIELSDPIKEKITLYLDLMTQFKVKERLNMQQALSYWMNIISAYHNEEAAKNQSKVNAIRQYERKDSPSPSQFGFFSPSQKLETQNSMEGPLLMCHTL